MAMLTKIVMLAIMEFGGFYLLITGVVRTAKVWDTPLRDAIIREPLAGATAIVGGILFAGLFMQKRATH